MSIEDLCVRLAVVENIPGNEVKIMNIVERYWVPRKPNLLH